MQNYYFFPFPAVTIVQISVRIVYISLLCEGIGKKFLNLFVICSGQVIIKGGEHTNDVRPPLMITNQFT